MSLADRLDPTLRRLAAVWLRHPARLAAVGGALAVLAASRLGLTWVVKLWAEGPATTRDASGVPFLLAVSVGLSALLVAAVFVARYAQASLDQRVLADLRQAIASRLLRAELQAVRGRPIGDILSRLAGDLAQLVGTGDLIFRRLVGDLALGCGALALMVWLDPGLTVLILGLIPLSALALGLVGRRLRRRATGAQASAGALHALFGQQLRGLATIKAATAESEETRRFAVANEVVRRRAMRGELLAAVAVALVWLLTSAAILAVVAYGTSQVVAGRTTPGGLLAFALLAAQVVEPLRRLAEAHANLQRALAAAARVFELVDLGPLEAVGGRQPERPTVGSLRLERVAFSWPPRAGGSTPTPVLAEVGLTLPAGSQVALVGASGAGKSTLASLLIRLVEPDRGRVLLDGVDLRSLDLVGLRRAVCLVDQEPFIFAATVAANLAYGSEGAARASIVAAAELVGLGPWLASLPAGVDTPLREAGIDLSGGQRQRIALARAVLREPAVLVLDEVTSALDGELEAQIFDALADWLGRRTVVVIAHRLATIRRMARVVVLDDGSVVADGSLAEVLTSSARARALFAPQLAGEAVAATPTAVPGGPLGVWPDDEMGSRRLRPVLWT